MSEDAETIEETVEEAVEEVVEDVRPIAGIGTLVFGKWDASEITCKDPALAPYINLSTCRRPSYWWTSRKRLVWKGKTQRC